MKYSLPGLYVPVWVTVVCAIVFFGPCPSAFANTTTINAVVRDNQPATLEVAPSIDNSTVTTPALTITGTVHNVSQIMVYVDGVYSITQPLDFGAEVYTLALLLTPGEHMIRLVGIDPYTASQVEKSITVHYVPGVQQEPNKPGQPVTDTVDQAGNAIQQLGEQANQQIDQASTSGPLKVMVDGSYKLLKYLGLVTVRDGFGLTSPMVVRFIVMSTGLTLGIFPWGVYLLLNKLRLLPAIQRSHRLTISIRVVGATLFILPLIFIS